MGHKTNCGCNSNATKEFTKTANITERIPLSRAAATRRRYCNKSDNSVCALNQSTNALSFVLLIITMTLVLLLQAQQTSAGPVPSPTQQQHRQNATWLLDTVTVAAANSKNDEVFSRLHKRHSVWRHEERSRHIAWANPCNGNWSEENEANFQRKPEKRILRMLQKSVRLTVKMADKKIDTSDIRQWSKHKSSYTFLPKMKANSMVALRRWHRQMQTFVAAFYYLERAQKAYDQCKLTRESDEHQELHALYLSARSILCEIETAINNTASPSERNLKTTQPLVMERRLKFATNLSHVFMSGTHRTNQSRHHNAPTFTGFACEVPEVKPLDYKFAKYLFYAFQHSMLKVLRVRSRQNGSPQITWQSASGSHSSSSSIAELPPLSSSSSQQTDSQMNNVSQLGVSSTRNRSKAGSRRRKIGKSNMSTASRKPKLQRPKQQ